MEHANHSEHIILNDVVDSHVVEPLHCPGAQAGEDGIAELIRRSHLRHPAEVFNGVVNRIDESVRCVKSIFQKVVPVLPDDVRFCRRSDDVPHELRFRPWCFLARSMASALRSFQNARVSGISLPPAARPSTSSASRRWSSSRSCAARSSERKYSLTLPYPFVASCSSMNVFRDSGSDMVTVVRVASYCFSSHSNRHKNSY